MNTRRIITSIGIIVAIAALAVLWALFRPELLFVNAAVNEAALVAASTPTAGTSSASAVLPTALAKPPAHRLQDL